MTFISKHDNGYRAPEVVAEMEQRDPTLKSFPKPAYRTPDSVAIVSGGLDSTTLVYDMLRNDYVPHMLSFDYGQRHRKELEFAAWTAEELNLRHDIIDLSSITHLISNSALTGYREAFTDGENLILGEEVNVENYIERRRGGPLTGPSIDVPEGHYAEDTMKATVVPNRNMIMLSIAGGVAVNYNYRTIGIGVHGGDHFIYPDCRPEFIWSAGQTILVGNTGFHNFEQGSAVPDEYKDQGYTSTAIPITSPYLYRTKADIALIAMRIGVPLHQTWSCYKGGDKHCGKCGTCVERLEAIDEAQRKWPTNFVEDVPADTTEYEDNTSWRNIIAQERAAKESK